MKLGAKSNNNAKVLVVALSLALTACDLSEPTTLTQKNIVVQEHGFSDEMLTADVNNSYLAGLAEHFTKFGQGTLDVVVTYDQQNYRNTAMMAGQNVANITESLRDLGVSSVNARVLPVKDQGDYSKVLVSYDYYTAQAPDGCGSMPGMDGGALAVNPDYQLGCTLKTLTAQQVSRPKDLMGAENSDHLTEGRSATNVVNQYRKGEPNKKLDGQAASEQ